MQEQAEAIKMINKTLTIILILACFGCISPTKQAENKVKEAKNKTEKAVEKVTKPISKEEESDILDRLISTPVIFLYAFAALFCVIGAVIAVYRAKLVLAASLAGGAVLCGILPVVIVVFFKAMITLLYILAGILVILAIIGLWFVYSKAKMELDKQKAENEKLNSVAEDLYQSFNDTDPEIIKGKQSKTTRLWVKDKQITDSSNQNE